MQQDVQQDQQDEIYYNDEVNHPPHYTQGAIECIDAMEAMVTPEEFRAHCRLTAFKYIWRARHRGNEATNYAKAQWYLDRAERSVWAQRGAAMGDPGWPEESTPAPEETAAARAKHAVRRF